MHGDITLNDFHWRKAKERKNQKCSSNERKKNAEEKSRSKTQTN